MRSELADAAFVNDQLDSAAPRAADPGHEHSPAAENCVVADRHLRRGRADWQTSKTRVEVLSEGAPGLGFRVREWTKPPGGKEFEQVVEFTEFDRPNLLHVHVVEGPQPIDGRWVLKATETGTQVEFVAEGALNGWMRVIEPIVRRSIGRQFSKYHEHLRQNAESAE